jgi:hypothetical protein
MEHFIALPHGAPGEGFKISDLVSYLRKTHKDWIIQGQTNCSLADHHKPNSLDVWIRNNHTTRKNTKQASNDLLHEIIETGLFEEGNFTCPDSGRRCKGIKLVK